MEHFDAFISYSHAADGRLAPAVQSGLQRLAKKASPESAASEWVNREVVTWLERKPLDHILIVVTLGSCTTRFATRRRTSASMSLAQLESNPSLHPERSS